MSGGFVTADACSISPRDGELDRLDQSGLGASRGEGAERVDRPLAVMARPFERVAERSRALEQADGQSEVGVGGAAARHRVAPESAFALRAARISEDDGKGD